VRSTMVSSNSLNIMNLRLRTVPPMAAGRAVGSGELGATGADYFASEHFPAVAAAGSLAYSFQDCQVKPAAECSSRGFLFPLCSWSADPDSPVGRCAE